MWHAPPRFRSARHRGSSTTGLPSALKCAAGCLGRSNRSVTAQSMRRGPTHVIGCVIRDINIPWLAAFVHAAHNVLDRAGFSLLLSNSEGREDRERELLVRLSSQRSDGIMIGPYSPMTPAFAAQHRQPHRDGDRDEPAWADAVMADHAGAPRTATSRLIDLGHRRLALLTGAPTI
jgi:LacI family transcriptional regulator